MTHQPDIKFRSVDVFTPNDYPKHTYVVRSQAELERKLKQAVSVPGQIISISGPSKSGKTVLVEKVVGDDALICVTGAGVHCAGDLWSRVLDWMDVPTSVASRSDITTSGKLSAQASGVVGAPLVGSVSGGGSLEATRSNAAGVTTTRSRRGLADVVKEIGNSDFVVLIDDFHYMRREVQEEVVKEIKEAARSGVKICTASVPHRSDDVVRTNPELRGRVEMINSDYWRQDDLVRIAESGFPLLNIKLPTADAEKLALECSGSPQLMQAICLQLCHDKSINESLPAPIELRLGQAEMQSLLERTSTRADFSSLLARMHRGPKTRGNERKEFDFTDRTKGDVYRCVLLALSQAPSRLSFPWPELSRRINTVASLSDQPPTPQSAYLACEQICRIALDMYPDQRIIEYNDQVVDIVDPYFLFYLRWSSKLRSLAESA